MFPNLSITHLQNMHFTCEYMVNTAQGTKLEAFAAVMHVTFTLLLHQVVHVNHGSHH